MKALLTVLLLFPTCLFAQDIAGIWTGYLTTTEKKLPYEIIVSDSSGILVGYSHITFTVKGKEVIAVKTISVTNDNGTVTLEDKELIDNNFPESQPKHVKQIATLELQKHDSVITLTGTFKANKIVNEKPIYGSIFLQKRSISDSSRLMAKLNTMDLAGSLSFMQLQKQTGKVATDKPDVTTSNDYTLANKKIIPVVAVNIPKPQKPVVAKDTSTITTKPTADKKPEIAVADTKPKEQKIIAPTPPAVKKPAVTPPVQKTVASAPPKVIKTQAVQQPPVKQQQLVTTKQVAAVTPVQKTVAPPAHVPEPEVITTGAATDIAHRKIENIQTLYFSSDSITVTLYDNGYVDGDTVSIILNGRIIMPKVGLSTHPVTKTVYTTDLGDSLQFVMYAENLGSIPPNTGLMILQDGKQRHEIYFSGDLEKNAAITLRREHN